MEHLTRQDLITLAEQRLAELSDLATGIGLALEAGAKGLPLLTVALLAGEADALCQRLYILQAGLPTEGAVMAPLTTPK
jgi:hypothetical protein